MSGLRSTLAQSALARRAYRWLKSGRREAREAGTTRVGSASSRLLIAPVNSAGQAYAWARAAERLDGVAAANFMYRDRADVFAFPADHSVPTALFVSNERWQRAQRQAVARRFTHVIIESGRQILDTEEPLTEQIGYLQRHGAHVALLFHGSDIRIPSVNAQREPDSPFVQNRYPETERLEEIARRNHDLIERLGLPVFVSTPDLLEEVPSATWLPVVVDTAHWAAAAPIAALSRDRVRVVHAPSNAGLKGSELIAETMQRLHDEGLVDYRELRGVPAATMAQHYGDADIVLDQFALGIYGVAACEAMAAGRLVVSHVSAGVRTAVKERTGFELPIVESDAHGLEATIRTIVSDRSRYIDLAASGPAFTTAVHDGRRSAAALTDFLGVRADGIPSDRVRE